MAWRETERAKAVQVRRIYRCTDCGHEFRWIHADETEDPPGCPVCVAGAEKPPAFVPPMPALLTVKSKAIDYTQAMVEQDYGLTDFNDNMRAGDIAYKGPAPMHTAEREALTREMVAAGVPDHVPMEHREAAANFWQGNTGQAASTLGSMTVAAQASAAAKAQGVDPVGMLESASKSGNMPLKLNVVASSDAKP